MIYSQSNALAVGTGSRRLVGYYYAFAVLLIMMCNWQSRTELNRLVHVPIDCLLWKSITERSEDGFF